MRAISVTGGDAPAKLAANTTGKAQRSRLPHRSWRPRTLREREEGREGSISNMEQSTSTIKRARCIPYMHHRITAITHRFLALLLSCCRAPRGSMLDSPCADPRGIAFAEAFRTVIAHVVDSLSKARTSPSTKSPARLIAESRSILTSAGVPWRGVSLGASPWPSSPRSHFPKAQGIRAIITTISW
jgi:hypothetical protein